MKKTIHAGLFLLIIFLFNACYFLGPSVKGDGHVTKETRQISGFEKLATSAGIEVFLIPDSSEFLIVEADENLHEYIKTDLEHQTLKIRTEGRIRWAKSRKVYVHYKQLKAVKSSSGSIVRSEQAIKNSHLEITASSGAQQYLEIDAGKLESQCSSGAQINLSGHCRKARLQASSGAHLKGSELFTDECDADVSSGAHIRVGVRNELTAEASSGGHIYYSGEPTKTSVHSSSGGSISKD